MATPIAAGAYAVLAGAFPSATVDQIVKTFQDTGRPVTEPVSGKTLIALDLSQGYAKMTQQISSPSQATPGRPSLEQATRFLVEIPAGDSASKQAAVENSIDEIQKMLDTRLGVSQVGPDALSVTTERPVEAGRLKNALQQHLGSIGA
jgi:hypothetical protein